MSSNFRELLDHARNKRIAIGAFNVFNYVSTKASIQVANELNTPILLQTSVNTVRKFGAQNLFQMMDLLRRQSLVPILFHLDHCTDPSLAKECIDVGWDSVMIDISAKPIEMNIAITSEIKRYAQKKGICVEGELGIISGVEDELSAEAETQAEYHSCMKFLSETDIDAFAPSIGTAHGMYTKEVKLNYQLVKRLAENTKVP
ncbi:MAG: class II fructose-bisphosphate aldolase, partial [Sphaerochaetaceae bacterium]